MSFEYVVNFWPVFATLALFIVSVEGFERYQRWLHSRRKDYR